MANSVDSDQTAPLGAVRSRSTLFAQTCLSENLGSLRYMHLVSIGVSLVMRKPVFGVYDQVRFKPASSATETS